MESAVRHNIKFYVHFSFERSKEKRTKKKKPFNVSLTLHWASLRGFRICTNGTTARNNGIWLVPLDIQQELNLSCLYFISLVISKLYSTFRVFSR